MSANGLFGKRVDPSLAGIRTIGLVGRLVAIITMLSIPLWVVARKRRKCNDNQLPGR